MMLAEMPVLQGGALAVAVFCLCMLAVGAVFYVINPKP